MRLCEHNNENLNDILVHKIINLIYRVKSTFMQTDTMPTCLYGKTTYESLYYISTAAGELTTPNNLPV